MNIVYPFKIGVWRSLVARLNGVQEAASSILVTPTKNNLSLKNGRLFFIIFDKKGPVVEKLQVILYHF